MGHIYIMEYYSAIKRNESGSFVEMWMGLDLYKDPLYYQFTEYNDPSFLALTEDEFFHKA